MKAIRHFYAFTFLLAALLSTSAHAQDITPLEPGKAITRTAKQQQVDTYQLTLTAGQFVRVIVEENEVDVSVDLIAPDNKPVHSVNATRFFGKESLSWEVVVGGTYKLVIRSLSTNRTVASYQAQLAVKDAATAQDKQRITAEHLLTEIARIGPRALSLEQKVEKHKEGIRLWQALSDKQQEAYTHEALAMTYAGERKYELARESFKQALALKEEIRDHLGRIYTLSNFGTYARAERNASALGNSDRGLQLLKLDEDYHQQALALSREIKHRGAERFILTSLTNTYRVQSLPEKAIAMWEQILVIDRESKNRTDEANTLRFLGQDSNLAKRDEEARRYYEEAIAIFRELKDRRNEAIVLRAIGLQNNTALRYETALPYFEEALTIFRELKDQPFITSLLSSLGETNGHLGRYENAERYYDEHLATVRAAKDRRGEAMALIRIGRDNSSWSRYEKAIGYYEKAIPIYQELKDRKGEGMVYRQIATPYVRQGRYGIAIEYQEKAMAIWRETNSEFEIAAELSNLGMTYARINYEKSIAYSEQALSFARKAKNRRMEEHTLLNLGDAHHNLGLYSKAQEYYEQALTLCREIKSKRGESDSLWGLGLAFNKQGQPEKAVQYYDQSLDIIRQLRSHFDECWLLTDFAEALRLLGQSEKAISNDLLALRIAREIKARDSEAMALNGLRQDWQTRNQPQLATFFGKQAVNTYQEMRSGIRSLDQDTQRSFLKAKEQTYRDLADLLISQGRLPEAEQVIRMLKEEEYFEYVRRDQDNSPKGEKAALTPEEAVIEKRYREIADQITALGTERGELIAKPARTATEEQRLANLEADLTVANQMFQKFLEGLANEMGRNVEAKTRTQQLREAQGLMEDLRELGKGTVALYTLVGDNKFRVILTTADVQKGFEYPIKAAELNRKILAFRNVLQNPKLDPLPLAQELYKVLVAPLAKDLKAARAETLMWSLDGVLRYVPIAALHDGEKYLVERWRNVVFTPASNARLKDTVSRNWKALGLGVTRSFGANTPALPGVADEMRGIINDGNSTKGVLPGTIKLDEQFTQDAMLTGLRQRPPVVHVASHFQFKPGNETDSALLLGDGKFLSLAQIKAYPNVFGGVELLTLSACNTATSGSDANGKEVEGFGVLAQRQGAKAVVASLWPVADRSTKNLMQEFYRLRETKANSTKAEAIRQAQIKLLRGELQITGEVVAARDITHETGKATNLPPYKVDPKAPYAHPYYWAPFILIGNWK
ncbi:MAG: tetratricopeptide repeat protein [Blastocatellia bacterium]|nr:tetratricopeptide repeat protein [Blastocatellia bacterium]